MRPANDVDERLGSDGNASARSRPPYALQSVPPIQLDKQHPRSRVT